MRISDWSSDVCSSDLLLAHGSPLYMALYGFGIIFFCFFYTAVVFNPEETAENLKRNGGFIPGIRPGKNTEKYLDFVLTPITVIGAAYLALICLVPEFLIAKAGIPFYLGGTSLLIVVNRSEGRRVGNEGVSACRSWWQPDAKTKINHEPHYHPHI